MNKTIITNSIKKDRSETELSYDYVFAYEKPVLHFLYKMTGNLLDSEDLTQETLIKIYRNLDKYDSSYKFSTWVFAIAKNTAYDWMRKNKNKELLIIDDDKKPFDQYYNKRPNVSLDQWNRTNLIDLSNAMNEIRPIYKKVLTLFYIQGFSYKEVAEILEIPVNTVKTYIYRAKILLRGQLA